MPHVDGKMTMQDLDNVRSGHALHWERLTSSFDKTTGQWHLWAKKTGARTLARDVFIPQRKIVVLLLPDGTIGKWRVRLDCVTDRPFINILTHDMPLRVFLGEFPMYTLVREDGRVLCL